jgi:hypothetical protein
MWPILRGGWKVLRCSFCGKSQDKVRKLIAGPKVHICEECVDLCIDILKEELGKKPQLLALCSDQGDAGDDTYSRPGIHLQHLLG